MSSGSWGSFAEDPYIGTSPMHMDAYAEQYLGWLDLKTLNAGDKATFKLGPAEHDTSHDHRAAAIDLPAYQRTEKPFPTDGADQDYRYSGQGEILPVDSHPDRIITPDGKDLWGGRWQAREAPFSLDQQSLTLTQAGVGSKTDTADRVTTFSDSPPTAYHRANLRYNSVNTAGSGVRLRVLDANADRTQYTVQVDEQ